MNAPSKECQEIGPPNSKYTKIIERNQAAEVILEQSFYEFHQDSRRWEYIAPQAPNQISTKAICVSSFTVVTWNVDFMRPYEAERLTALLSHIQLTVVNPLPPSSKPHPPTHTIILLQELHYSCFSALLAHPSVRASYALSSVSPATWAHSDASYGLVTLIPRALTPTVAKIFRSPFAATTMAREALYVDLRVRPDKTIRIANTHLESLRGRSDQMRLAQLACIAHFLRAPEVYGGVVGGDMNPIGPLDGDLPRRLGLVDAWVATREDTVRGAGIQHIREEVEDHTWGYQPPSKYPPQRLDKVFLAGNLQAESMERIGVGLKVLVPSGRNKNGAEIVWVSDHYGLVARINVA